MNTKYTALLVSLAAVASAQTQEEITQLNVILNDVRDNLSEYMALLNDPSSGFSVASMPQGVLQIGGALATATNSAFTSMYSDVDFAGLSSFLPRLPRYSSRLEPALRAADAPLGGSASNSTVSALNSTSIAADNGSNSSAPVSSVSASRNSTASSVSITSRTAAAEGNSTVAGGAAGRASETESERSSSRRSSSRTSSASARTTARAGETNGTANVSNETSSRSSSRSSRAGANVAKAATGISAGALAAAVAMLL
ncbi:SRP1/TIP1 family protein KNAG_0L00920 [Huiozyma naganishii CBS 8797]|uniref:Temperature shock-inducible protein 1 n=1 Tax=Huiozyma naganishii (strain ATCC MYA-139 / BCRC 22969 / CBS 8797 / KCTC 17520 / NBRC 10181 / NCYC 3082 / Yp74L-3) TaxID=1071383 RepID=J7RS41_HUIN7|nr:hypothetical protein KNAG_0L00920 [Kazachstania naganishii CBS 8797]CCK72713.1 hypothetical protein KNAG_0L00920 [Kazachstania naganishii CBS 8797]